MLTMRVHRPGSQLVAEHVVHPEPPLSHSLTLSLSLSHPHSLTLTFSLSLTPTLALSLSLSHTLTLIQVKHLTYSTAHGKVADGDDEFSFFLPPAGRAEHAARLSSVCASAGVHWGQDGTKVRDWEQLDDSLHVAGAARQNVWRAVVDGESGEAYYWNVCTGETVWHRPAEMLRNSCSQPSSRAAVIPPPNKLMNDH